MSNFTIEEAIRYVRNMPKVVEGLNDAANELEDRSIEGAKKVRQLARQIESAIRQEATILQ